MLGDFKSLNKEGGISLILDTFYITLYFSNKKKWKVYLFTKKDIFFSITIQYFISEYEYIIRSWVDHNLIYKFKNISHINSVVQGHVFDISCPQTGVPGNAAFL